MTEKQQPAGIPAGIGYKIIMRLINPVNQVIQPLRTGKTSHPVVDKPEPHRTNPQG